MSDLEASLGKALERKSKTQKQRNNLNTETKKSGPVGVKRGRGGHLSRVNPHSKRLTLDITPEQDRLLAQFGLDNGTKKNPTLRALIEILGSDEALQDRVLDWVKTQKS